MAYPEPRNLDDVYGPGAENADDGVDEAAELFALAQAGDDRTRIEALRRIRAMSAVARRELRQAIERLDGLLDECALESHLARRTGRNE